MKKRNIFKWFIDGNPVFVLLLGMCSTLAISVTFENSYMMGISVLLVLLFSNIIASLISKFISNEIRIPAYIIIITTFVTLIQILLKEYVTPLYESFSIYLPLIAVNCIILGRVLTNTKENTLIGSIKDSLKVGLQYTISLSIFGLIREVLGSNTITIMDRISSITGYKEVIKVFPDNSLIPNTIFISSAGAFILLGIIIGLINTFKDRGEEK